MKLGKVSHAATAGLVIMTFVGCSNTTTRSSADYPDRATSADRSISANVTSADKDFAIKAMQGGMAEVELGHLAQQRGSSDEVREYGKRLVGDHTKANNDLKDIASREGIDLPSDVNQKQRDTINRFAKLSGAQFDKAFLKDSVSDHRDDIQEFQKQAESGGDQALKTFAQNSLPVLQDHLNMAMNAEAGSNK